MGSIKKLNGLILIFLIGTAVQAEEYTVSLYFEMTESSLNTLFRTQVYPHPVGVHNGEAYEIMLWDPAIEVVPGEVRFHFTIHANVDVGEDVIQYDYPFIVPLAIPSGTLSVSGIFTFLEGIPDQINAMEGPQWLKDIIIAEYEGLELTVYPNSLLEDANASIPGFIDVTVTDISFTGQALTDLLRFTLSVDVTGNAPDIQGQWEDADDVYRVRFQSNIEIDVLFVGIYSLLGGSGENDEPGLTLNPGVWSDPIGVDLPGNTIASGQYRCKVLFGSPYGWFAVYYVFNNFGETGWNDMSIYLTL
jgi:hypothetical protein